MTFPGGDPGQNPYERAGESPPGAYEAPPIEQSPTGGYDIPPTSYPGPGYPPPPPVYGGYPPPGYPAYPPAPSGTNTLAIAALVAAGVGVFCGIGSVAGIVLGIIALNQIKQTGQSGHGLAVAGIVVGAISLVISVLWTIPVLMS